MVTIVGVGLGNKSYITYDAMKTIENSQIIIGTKRLIDTFVKKDIEVIDISIGIDKVIDYININYNKNITVLSSGDVGFYSIASTLKERLNQNIDIEFMSGISSLQYFCSKLKIKWSDIALLSMHGRDEELISTVRTNSKTFVLTGGKNSINYILSLLSKNRLDNLFIHIGENLSYSDEKITSGEVNQLINKKFSSLSVMIVENLKPINIVTSGIPDAYFIRGNVPMTKEEVRAITISKLQLSKEHIVYDIGAGTGSISIECALHVKKVYSIDFNENSIRLIESNKNKFGLNNIEVIKGKAPEILDHLPPPDRVFIGGSSKNIKDIIKLVLSKNPNVRIVINSIMIETLTQALDYLTQLNYSTDIVQVSISKLEPISYGHMLVPQNPVFILTTFN